jgi:hypothetical protein
MALRYAMYDMPCDRAYCPIYLYMKPRNPFLAHARRILLIIVSALTRFKLRGGRGCGRGDRCVLLCVFPLTCRARRLTLPLTAPTVCVDTCIPHIGTIEDKIAIISIADNNNSWTSWTSWTTISPGSSCAPDQSAQRKPRAVEDPAILRKAARGKLR